LFFEREKVGDGDDAEEEEEVANETHQVVDLFFFHDENSQMKTYQRTNPTNQPGSGAGS
jgi:hypothetical protein